MAVKPIPDGYQSVIPYLVVDNASELIDFLQQAFAAKLLSCAKGKDDKIMNAELKIADSVVMVADTRDSVAVSTSTIYFYVTDTDAVYQSALTAGATSIMEPRDQFYGDRNAGISDPCGNQWWIATHIKDVSEQEIQQHMQASLE